MLWNGVARTGGDAVAALRQTADRYAQGTAHRRQKGWTRGPIRQLQLTEPPGPPLVRLRWVKLLLSQAF